MRNTARVRLSCKGLSKAFDGVQAVENVSIDLVGPDVVGLIGPNGAGKTTLLNLLTGFEQPDAGRWVVGGVDVSGSTPVEIVGRGIVRSFQHPQLVAGLTVLDNLLLAAPMAHNESFIGAFFKRASARLVEEREKREADRLLKWTGLSSHAREPASALSYGQQKLVALCCCLATHARILLLDEPVAGVHPALVSDIVTRIRELGEQGYLVVVIEHNLDAIRAVADRLLVMDRGKLIADGPVDDVLARQEVHDAYLR